MIVKNEKEIRQLKEEYQKKLKLGDWDITLKTNVPRDEFGDPGRVGESTWNDMRKVAVISLCDPSTMLPAEVAEYDQEETLVHELLHVKFALVTDFTEFKETISDRVYHQIIEDLAQTIVWAKRKCACGKTTKE